MVELNEEEKVIKEAMEKIRDKLWKVETTAGASEGVPDEQYVDICRSILDVRRLNLINREIRTFCNEPQPKDDDFAALKEKQSTKIRNAHIALDNCNEALRYAEPDTSIEAIALANRASLFASMKYFKDALFDIGMVRKTGKLPIELQSKLEQLEERVKENIWATDWESKDAAKYEITSVLNYEEYENHPVLAKVIKIDESKQYGRRFLSKYDLAKQQFILIEKDYIKAINIDKLRACSTCFEEDKCFLACKNCTSALFCSADCKTLNVVHEWECGTFLESLEFELRAIIYSIIMALNAFTTTPFNEPPYTDLKQLMDCVKEMLKTPGKLPEMTLDPLSKYQFFFNLSTGSPFILFVHPRTFTVYDGIELIYVVYELIMKIPRIAAIFSDQKSQRFLTHLIAHHCLVIRTNCFGDTQGQCVGLLQSLFNHSCVPNVLTANIGRTKFCFTGRRIKSRKQLFISYIGYDEPEELKYKDRLRNLKMNWGFDCMCPRCSRGEKPFKKRVAESLDVVWEYLWYYPRKYR